MLFSACRQKKDNEEEASRDCTDLSDLTSEDLAARKKFAYTDESPVGDQRCENCNLFLPVAQERKCGECLLFKGAVQPSGYCTYWAPQL